LYVLAYHECPLGLLDEEDIAKAPGVDEKKQKETQVKKWTKKPQREDAMTMLEHKPHSQRMRKHRKGET